MPSNSSILTERKDSIEKIQYFENRKIIAINMPIEKASFMLSLFDEIIDFHKAKLKEIDESLKHDMDLSNK